MPHVKLPSPSFPAKVCLLLILACGLPLAAPAQVTDEAAIQELILSGYRAYVLKDAPGIISLFSERSPHLPEFKLYVQQEFARNEKIRIESGKVLLVRELSVEGDRATARVHIEIRALDMETGRVAEGFGDKDSIFRFVREGGVWKVWQFTDTAVELGEALLAARTDAERAAVFAAKGEPTTNGLLNGLLEQARLHLEERGNQAQAATIYNFTLDLSRRLNVPFGVGGALVGLGDVYVARGDYRRAADNYQQVMKLAESLGSEEGVAAVSVKLGNIHFHQGNFAQAMEYYQRSAQAYQRLGSKIEIAYPLVSVGNVYFAQGEYAQALDYYRRSLKIYEGIFDKAGTAYLLNKIGDVYSARGQNAEAVEFYQKSLKLHEELGNKAMTAYALTNIGNVRHAEGNYVEALALSTRAVETARAGDGPEILWQALTSAGRAERALGEPERASRSFAEAINVIERLRQQAAGNEQDRQLSFESKTAPYREMVDLLTSRGDFAGAFAYAERAKGRVLLDVLHDGREDITKAMSAEEREQERTLDGAIVALNSRLKRETAGPRPEEARVGALESQLRNARLEYEAFQTRIYAAHPELKVQRGQAEPMNLGGAAALLPDAETALLEYVVTRERVYLFVITKRGGTGESDGRRVALNVYPIAVGDNELAGRVEEFRNKVGNNALDFREPARRLYDLLIKPAEAQLAGKRTVCIVPDASLWGLPFQALLSGENRYLLENHALFYVPSLSVLYEMKRREPRRTPAVTILRTSAGKAKASAAGTNPTSAPRMLLAFGNPALSEKVVAQAKSITRDQDFGPLPEAEQEVRSLTQFYGPARSKVFVGAEAREETAKSEAEKYRVLHFATHGTLDDRNPMYSRLALASAGANEDGFLEAREIIKLNIGADLVVLSACQTARGRVGGGEGLVGLSWAFFVAGSSTTVASQWKVDSAGTTLLMKNFHQLLTSQETPGGARASKAEALRGAALKLLSNARYRHPFYWAGFVVVGNGD